jgi:hypothetical protein
MSSHDDSPKDIIQRKLTARAESAIRGSEDNDNAEEKENTNPGRPTSVAFPSRNKAGLPFEPLDNNEEEKQVVRARNKGKGVEEQPPTRVRATSVAGRKTPIEKNGSVSSRTRTQSGVSSGETTTKNVKDDISESREWVFVLFIDLLDRYRAPTFGKERFFLCSFLGSLG